MTAPEQPEQETSAPAEGAAVDEAASKKKADDLARFTVAGAVVSLAGILATVIRTKAVALTLGATGVGMVAEVSQLVTNATVASQLAGGPSLTKWIAEAQRDGSRERMQVGLSASLALGLLLSGLGLLVATAIAPYVLPAHAWGTNVRWFVALAAGAIVASTVTGAIVTTLTALGDIRSTTKHALVGLALGTPLSIALILLLNLRGQFLSIFLTTALSFGIALLVLRRSALAAGLRFSLRWNREYTKKAIAVGTALVVTVYSRQLVYTAIRVALEKVGGPEQGAIFNGNYQASQMIVGVYFDLALSALFTYFAPRFAGATTAEELSAEVQAASKFCLRVATPLVFAAIAFRAPIIHALYSSRFDLAISLLGVMFCGDILRGVCYVHSSPLLYRGKLKSFLITETFFVTSSVLLSVGLIRSFGLMGVGYAYVLVYPPYLFLVRYMLARSCGARVPGKTIAVTLGVSAAAVAFTWLSTVVPWVRWVGMPVTLAWMWKTGALEPFIRRLRPIFQRGKPG